MQHRHPQRTSSGLSAASAAARSPPGTGPSSPELTTATASSRSRPSGTRSRNGCWTCRSRKVKCDEVHPRCGPCARLERECDWVQRWNFHESTRSTQDRLSNVNTAGNVVWDPNAARQGSLRQEHFPWEDPRRDSLPAFGQLTSDEERERKAEAYNPGTFNVVVNPASFTALLEYQSPGSSRRPSLLSRRSSVDSRSTQRPQTPHVVSRNDPNTVILTQFQDTATSVPSFLAEPQPSRLPGERRASAGAPLRRLAIATSAGSEMSSQPLSRSPERRASAFGAAPATAPSMLPNQPYPFAPMSDDELIHHYERFIAMRILPVCPQIHDIRHQDGVVLAARNFAPLLHAMCSVSLLVLANKGLSRWEDAIEREGQSTQALQMMLNAGIDLNSDGVFYLHFLMLIYDVCSPATQENTWKQHMRQLQRMVLHRSQAPAYNHELDYQMLCFATTLDIQASLCGQQSDSLAKGFANNEFLAVQTYINPLEIGSPFHEQEVQMLPAIVPFTREQQRLSAVLSQLARETRERHLEGAQMQFVGSGPRWRARERADAHRQDIIAANAQSISAFQGEVWAIWSRTYPPYLARDDPRAGFSLTTRLRYLFEVGYLFHCINVIYSNTCMYPEQYLDNPTNASTVAVHCRHVIAIAQAILESGLWPRPPMVFAIFLAGIATPEAEVKVAAVRYMREFEGLAIGRNASRARQLLTNICEEQRHAVASGRRAEEVDWIALASREGLLVIDFGL